MLTEPTRTAASVADELRRLRAGIEQRPDVDGVELVHPTHRDDVGNLADYVARRQTDLRDLQNELARLGVSSLGRGEAHARVEVVRTTWLLTGARLERTATSRRAHRGGVVGDLPPRPAALRLAPGALLTLTADATPAPLPGAGEIARIGCTLPEAIAALRPGQRVELDDGVISGTVLDVDPGGHEALVRIARAPIGGAKLRAEKGINLPDTDIEVDVLSPADIDAPDAIGHLLDGVELSFVRDAGDVHTLHAALRDRGLELGVVLKIETADAFEELPELLAAVMRARAEVTDAAMATRAECVMLNKGDHIDLAVRTLDDILRRMAGHQHKKASLLRQLRSW